MGTGYTRQAEASIANGLVADASDIDLEFDTIESAFNGTTGHSHDGTTGEGPLITLTSAVTGTLPVANGGTGAATLTDGGILLGSGTGAITAMSVLADGAIVVGDGTTDPVALSAFTSSTGTLKHESGGIEADISAVADGDFIVGTGAGTMGLESGATARASLGVAIGTDVQAYNAALDDISGLAVTDGNIIVGDGANWVAESGATARTSLGLGTGDTPQFTAITFGGSNLDTYIGATAWTPTIAGDGTAGSAVYVTQVGRYVQIGALVFITGRIDLSSFSGAVGNTIIGGLPKTVLNVTGLFGAMAAGYSGINLTTNYTQFNLLVQTNTKTMFLRQYGDNQADTTIDVSAISSTAEIFFSGCYLTAE